jgi:hypothetical protein
VSGDNVTYLHAMTDQPVPAQRVLDAARACEEVLVLGFLPDGTFYCASSTGDGGTLLWWLERFKYGLLAGEYDACP